MTKISEKLLAQRLRNRIMEVLSIYSADEDWEYLGADEVINQWEDFVDEVKIPIYVAPVFSEQERKKLLAFHALWLQYCESTPKTMPPFSKIKTTSEWLSLKNKAVELLAVFNVRGRLSEEIEIT